MMSRNAHLWSKPLAVSAGIALLAVIALAMVFASTGADKAARAATANPRVTVTAYATLTPRPVPTATVTRYVEVEAAPVTTTATTRVTVTVKPKAKKVTPAKVKPTPALRTTDDRIEEDDPHWNCATMGNRQCGPATHNGAKRTQSFEDGSATYADGYMWDPDTRSFRRL